MIRKLSTTALLAALMSIASTPAFAGCNFPTVSTGSSTNYNVVCPPQGSSLNTFWAQAHDQVPYNAPYGPVWVEPHGEPISCLSTYYIDRPGYTTISQQIGQYTWQYWSRWYVGVDKVLSTGEHINMEALYKDGCLRSSPSPILISFEQGADLKLTSALDGVDFDLESSGMTLRLGWTEANSNVGWLVLGSGVTNGSKLFGNLNQQAPPLNDDEPENGYRALRISDDNADGQIDSQDPIFSQLNVWFDHDHDGAEDSGELVPLLNLVTSFSLDYKRVGKRDQYGNGLRYRSSVTLPDGSKRFSYDVFPANASELNGHIPAEQSVRASTLFDRFFQAF